MGILDNMFKRKKNEKTSFESSKLDAKQIAMNFISSKDWQGKTYGDFKRGIEWLIRHEVLGECSEEEWKQYHESYYSEQLDFALYTMNIFNHLVPDPNLTIAQANEKNSTRKMDPDARRNALIFYLNGYFYKYIAEVELPKLRGWIEANPEISIEQVVDCFISDIVFRRVAQEYPDEAIDYHQIEDVPQSRIEDLENLRSDIITDLENNDEELYKDIFLLMTYFAGSPYRGVHKAICVIFNADMGDFREAFFDQIPQIIENKGKLKLNIHG